MPNETRGNSKKPQEPGHGLSMTKEERLMAQEAALSMIETGQDANLRDFLKKIRIESLDDGYFWGLAIASAAASEKSHECLHALIDAGVPLDAPIDEGYSALSRSADANNAVAIHALCGLGANIETREECGRTPLLLAAYCGNEAAIEALVMRGASVVAKDFSARSAVDLLLAVAEWQSKPEQKASGARSLALLMTAGARAGRIANMSMMAQVAASGNSSMVSAAIETGAVNVDDASGNGLTALMFCARSDIFPSESCVSALLAHGARTDLVDARGFTALDYAIQAQNQGIAQLIREAAAVREAEALDEATRPPRPSQSRRAAL